MEVDRQERGKEWKEGSRKKEKKEVEKKVVLQYACYFKGSGEACAALCATQ